LEKSKWCELMLDNDNDSKNDDSVGNYDIDGGVDSPRQSICSLFCSWLLAALAETLLSLLEPFLLLLLFCRFHSCCHFATLVIGQRCVVALSLATMMDIFRLKAAATVKCWCIFGGFVEASSRIISPTIF